MDRLDAWFVRQETVDAPRYLTGRVWMILPDKYDAETAYAVGVYSGYVAFAGTCVANVNRRMALKRSPPGVPQVKTQSPQPTAKFRRSPAVSKDAS
jgi:hypothetical protein